MDGSSWERKGVVTIHARDRHSGRGQWHERRGARSGGHAEERAWNEMKRRHARPWREGSDADEGGQTRSLFQELYLMGKDLGGV